MLRTDYELKIEFEQDPISMKGLAQSTDFKVFPVSTFPDWKEITGINSGLNWIDLKHMKSINKEIYKLYQFNIGKKLNLKLWNELDQKLGNELVQKLWNELAQKLWNELAQKLGEEIGQRLLDELGGKLR